MGIGLVGYHMSVSWFIHSHMNDLIRYSITWLAWLICSHFGVCVCLDWLGKIFVYARLLQVTLNYGH